MPDTQNINAMMGLLGTAYGGTSGGFNFNWANIIAGLIFGIIGWTAFQHGRKEKNFKPIAIGIGLMVYPYFICDTFLTYVIGVVLTAALYFWKE